MKTVNWDKALDGEIHILEAGVDFDEGDTTVEELVRSEAEKRGVEVKTKWQQKNGNLLVQSQPKTN